MELQIPRTFSSRKRDYERLGMTVPAVFLLYDTSQIVLDGFLHHIFQRNLVLCGDALAIIVFGRIVRHSSRRTPRVVVSEKIISVSLAASSGFTKIVSSIPGRLFFICTGIPNTSNAPSCSRRSIT